MLSASCMPKCANAQMWQGALYYQCDRKCTIIIPCEAVSRDSQNLINYSKLTKILRDKVFSIKLWHGISLLFILYCIPFGIFIRNSVKVWNHENWGNFSYLIEEFLAPELLRENMYCRARKHIFSHIQTERNCSLKCLLWSPWTLLGHFIGHKTIGELNTCFFYRGTTFDFSYFFVHLYH